MTSIRQIQANQGVNRQIRHTQTAFQTALKSLQALKKEELAAAEAASPAPIEPPSATH